MERIVAIAKLRKLLGKSIGWRVDMDAPNAEERATARELQLLAVGERNDLDRKVQERKLAILETDQEYVALRTAQRAAAKRVQELSGTCHRYRFTVGKTVCGLFFSVMAQGDSWEEVIAKVTKDLTKV